VSEAPGILMPVLPDGWQPCDSTAVEAFRFLPEREVLQLVFVEGQMAYDYPCTGDLYERFVRAPSKGRFVNEVLRPYADRQGGAGPTVRWRSR
jgi:KTSC domain